jgi:hypothetical protein
VFSGKSAQPIEKKRVEFYSCAKKRKRVRKSVKRKGVGRAKANKAALKKEKREQGSRTPDRVIYRGKYI